MAGSIKEEHMAAKKRMTNKEKQARAAAKKRLQAEGILPPDKPRLNRKQFIEETIAEWEGRDKEGYLVWNLYLMRAVFCMMSHRNAGKITLEAVGAAKVLKLAMKLREFDLELKKQGRNEYTVGEQYEYIKDIINA